MDEPVTAEEIRTSLYRALVIAVLASHGKRSVTKDLLSQAVQAGITEFQNTLRKAAVPSCP